MQSRKQLYHSFWFHTKSHYVIFQCDDLICFRNDQIRNLQIYTCSRKSFASILDFDSRDISFLDFRHSSTLFNSRTSSKAFCHSLIWQLNHIKCLESWKRMKIFVLRKYWFEEITKVICFSNSKVLKCVLFYFYSLRSLYHSFEKTSDCYVWECLACFIVLLASHSINRLSRLTLRELIDLKKLKVCCFIDL